MCAGRRRSDGVNRSYAPPVRHRREKRSVYTIFTLAIISEKQRKAGGYSPAQDWARARRGLSASGSARLGAGAEGGPGAQVLRAGALLVRFFVGVAAASWSTLKARRRLKKLSRRSSQMGLWGASRPRVVSEDDESVLFSKMDQPSTTCEQINQ